MPDYQPLLWAFGRGSPPEPGASDYLWNAKLAAPLLKAGCHGFILPCIYGRFGFENVLIGSKQMSVALITRFSRHRAGTRYNKRGLSRGGHAAMTVETELILQSVTPDGQEGQISSFLQLRGSVPLKWQQPLVRMTAHPPVQPALVDDLCCGESIQSLCLHLGHLRNAYQNGPIILLNLLNSEKPEQKMLSLGLARALAQLKWTTLYSTAFH